MKKNVILCILFIISISTKTFAQTISIDNDNEDLFLYEVKVIDEFIERFNDDKSSFLRKDYDRQHRTYNITRSQLLSSLFNRENTSWRADPDVKVFFQQVLDKAHPQYIYFTDSTWYAETIGVFQYNNTEVEIPIILHIRNSDHGAKWMITGIGDNAILNDSMTSSITNDKQDSPLKYISTSSYATNFVELRQVFSNKMNPEYYFEPKVLATAKAKHFITLVLQNKITFQYAKDTKFYFYQVNNYIFTVERFQRKNLNNGWLISSIKKVTKNEKEAAKQQLLHL